MNLALPFLLLPIVFILGISVPAYLEHPPVIGYVEPNSAASAAGFQKGDIILEVNGEHLKTWRDANIAFQSNPDSLLRVRVERNGDVKTIEFRASSSPEGATAIGLGEPIEAKIGSVVEELQPKRQNSKKEIRFSQ